MTAVRCRWHRCACGARHRCRGGMTCTSVHLGNNCVLTVHSGALVPRLFALPMNPCVIVDGAGKDGCCCLGGKVLMVGAASPAVQPTTLGALSAAQAPRQAQGTRRPCNSTNANNGRALHRTSTVRWLALMMAALWSPSTLIGEDFIDLPQHTPAGVVCQRYLGCSWTTHRCGWGPNSTQLAVLHLGHWGGLQQARRGRFVSHARAANAVRLQAVGMNMPSPFGDIAVRSRGGGSYRAACRAGAHARMQDMVCQELGQWGHS